MHNTDASGIPVQWSVSWYVASTADGPLSFPFRTLMAGDHAPKVVRAEMNESLSLGSGDMGATVAAKSS